jgi:hypothetical protein
MSKIKDDNTILPEPEKIKKIEVNTENTLVPENYPAEQYLSWFMNDAQNTQARAGALFRGGFDNTDPRMMSLKQAAEDSIKEVEDDIVKLKEFLAAYVPPNK